MLTVRFVSTIRRIAAATATVAALGLPLDPAQAQAKPATTAAPHVRRMPPLVTSALRPLAPGPGLRALAGHAVIARPEPTAKNCEPHHDDVSALPLITLQSLPPDEYIASGKPTLLTFSAARAIGHLPALELSLRAYTEKLAPGAAVLRRELGWQVLEHARPALRQRELSGRSPWTADAIERSGFQATAYVNPRLREIMIAIAGTSFRDLGDLRSDYAALRHAVLPEQFRIALAYVRDVRERYGASHAIACSGHSLGGGACAYTAATLNLKAVTINPIASVLPHAVCRHALARIDNYVIGHDIAFTAYKQAGRHLLGNVIRLDSPWQNFIASYGAESSLRIDKLIAKPVAWVMRAQAHKLEAGLDRIARKAGVVRASAPLVTAAKPRVSSDAVNRTRPSAAAAGICHDGKQFFVCQVASGR